MKAHLEASWQLVIDPRSGVERTVGWIKARVGGCRYDRTGVMPCVEYSTDIAGYGEVKDVAEALHTLAYAIEDYAKKNGERST